MSAEFYQITDNDKLKHAEVNRKNDVNHSDENGGIVQQRRTTDLLFLIAIIAMWIAMTVVGRSAIESGNPSLVVAPVNDHGEVCGIDPTVKDRSLFYPSVLQLGLGRCVSECPSSSALPTSLYYSDYICLHAFDDKVAQVAANYGDEAGEKFVSKHIQMFCMDSATRKFDPSRGASGCLCNLKQASHPVLNRWCVESLLFVGSAAQHIFN